MVITVGCSSTDGGPFHASASGVSANTASIA